MGETTFYREKKQKNYTVIDNTFIKDKKLSAKAKGIMCYLLSLPDDWKIYLSELKNNFTDGKASISSGIKELMEHGYLKRERIHDKKGKFDGYTYQVIENPTFQPKAENPSTDKPKTDNPSTDNQQLLSTNTIQSTDILNTNNSTDVKKGSRYDRIFKTYLESNIVKHATLTTIMKDSIDMALKKYTEEEIKLGIERYGVMLNDTTYDYCNYKWTLNEFLTRGKGLGYFLNDGDKWLNYLKHKKEQEKKQATKIKSEFDFSFWEG